MLHLCPTSVNMANCWLSLLMGLALIQGLLTMSPIPVPEEEWDDFFRMMRDPSYRLPTTTLPDRYEVSLTPHFDTPPEGTPAFSFGGEVAIYLSPTEASVSEIVMHCNDLTIATVTVANVNTPDITINVPGTAYQCEMPYSFLRIPVTPALQMGQEYVARISFSGNLQTNMRGFYRSWYRDSTGLIRWMGTTQFQPGHARQAFPCYDEPGFKAFFDITINREPTFSPTISNMPKRGETILPDGRIAETFYRTPRTSTYLLAFIVSHYELAATNNDNARPFDIYARDNVGNTGEWALEVGEALLAAMEEYTQLPYYAMAENMDMKQAAIPDFSAGAMENWGLLTYREALILYDPENSNHFYRQRVANIVSHEIAHMWFGNLVTCAWWDNLWLNEGFARFYQYYLTGSVRPEMGYATRFITEQIHTAMLSDSIDSAHALTDASVNNPTAVSAHFSTITYAKGAAVLRMTQYLLGPDTYLKALRSYLQDRKFDVAEPHHLFAALDDAAIEDNSLSAYNGVTIASYFRTWSEQAGHPLLTVRVNQRTGEMIVTQARWQRDTGLSTIPTLWQIPITWTRGGAIDFEDLKPSAVISGQATVIQRGTSGLEWVIFNKQQTGFYRVNYDSNGWGLITQALRGSNRTLIHEYNRAQIVDDVFVLARAGVLSYTRALNILSFLEFEDAYTPWLAAIAGFNWLNRRMAHDPDAQEKLHIEIRRLSAAVTARLGFAEVPGETYMDGLQRMYVNEFLCNYGHEECIAAGVESFRNWKNGGFIPANMRTWVYCVGLREGTDEDFDYFWDRYLNEDLANEMVVMLQVAGCTGVESSLHKFMDAIVAGDDTIRPQDHTTALSSAITSNEVNTLRAFEWLKNNVVPTTEVLGSISSPLSTITGRLLNEQQIGQVAEWLEENRALIGAAYNTGINGINTARSNIVWHGIRVAELETYFETGYEDDVFEIDESDEDEDEDEDEDGDVGGEDSDSDENVPDPDDSDEEPDSANIAALSIVTLVVTLAINFVA